MKAMTMFTAQVASQQNNAHYPNPHIVTTAAGSVAKIGGSQR